MLSTPVTDFHRQGRTHAARTEKELLTKEALLNKLENFDISQKLLHYLEDQEGRQALSLLAGRLAVHMLERLEPHQAGAFLEKLINQNFDRLDLFKHFQEAAGWLSKNAGDDRIIVPLSEKLKEFIQSPGFESLVQTTIQDIFDRLESNAEKESAGKRLIFKLVLTLADFSSLSPSRLSSRLVSEAHEYLSKIQDPESVQRKGLEKWLEDAVASLRMNPSLQDAVRLKGAELLKGISLSQIFADHVFPYIREEEQKLKLQSFISGLVERLVSDFRENKADQEALNTYFRKALAKLVEENHHVIGQMVRTKLNSFSTEALVRIMEEKAGNDLQIIRINGSVVGGLTGLAIFLLTFWMH